MTQTSYPFDAGTGGVVLEAQWRAMAKRWADTGVILGGLNELAIAQHTPPQMGVDVATGQAWIEGIYYQSDAVEALLVTANPTGNPRIDTVVVGVDFLNNTSSLYVLPGTAAADPSPPVLTQTTSLWEYPLANVYVAAGAVSIGTANINDRREFQLTPGQDSYKEPVAVATTTALAASTITGINRVANATGALANIDGVAPTAGMRILDKDHATTSARGVWVLINPGGVGIKWRMVRAADFDASSDVRSGMLVPVGAGGSTLAGTVWGLTTANPITLGTTGLAFARIGSAGITVDTLANRPAADGTKGGFIASDKQTFYVDAGAWKVVAGLVDDVLVMPDLSGTDQVLAYTGTLLSTVTYNDQGTATKRASDTMAYTGTQLDSVTRRFYATDGVTLLFTVTIAFTYTGGNVTSTNVTVS